MRLYKCITIFVLLAGSYAFADKANLDIRCSPHSGLFDGGYQVFARKISEKKYALKIVEIKGWSPDTVKYNGTASLVSDIADGSRQFKLVDDPTSPRTIVLLRPNSDDVLEMLNGIKLSESVNGQERNIWKALECTVSKTFESDVSTCQ